MANGLDRLRDSISSNMLPSGVGAQRLTIRRAKGAMDSPAISAAGLGSRCAADLRCPLMTLHDLTRGFVLVAFCQCGHKADMDLQAPAAAKGWDLDTTQIRRCPWCSRCSSPQVQIRIVFDGGIKFKHAGMARETLEASQCWL